MIKKYVLLPSIEINSPMGEGIGVGSITIETSDEFSKMIESAEIMVLPEISKNLESKEMKLIGFSLVENNLSEDSGEEKNF